MSKSVFHFSWLLMIFAVVFFYAEITKTNFDRKYASNQDDLILQKIPSFQALGFPGDRELDQSFIYTHPSVIRVVHFWGTWCAPCEAEFPELLEMTDKLTEEPIHFFLIAVNDQMDDVKRFVKRFNLERPNISIIVDQSNQSMTEFGTVKVPETYVFDQVGNALTKYIGPQEWKESIYKETLKAFVDNPDPRPVTQPKITF
jgi:cytochrome c biogenesis protein CcmG, thiol:disulfide interchange protein DsbE